MTEPDLKPCPFCGGEASAISPDEVGCFNGECPSEPHVWSETGAIAAWNTRAIDPATERIEQLQSKLDKAVAALLECQEEIDQYSKQEYPLDHPVHERYRERYFDANPARIALAEIKGE